MVNIGNLAVHLWGWQQMAGVLTNYSVQTTADRKPPPVAPQTVWNNKNHVKDSVTLVKVKTNLCQSHWDMKSRSGSPGHSVCVRRVCQDLTQLFLLERKVLFNIGLWQSQWSLKRRSMSHNQSAFMRERVLCFREHDGLIHSVPSYQVLHCLQTVFCTEYALV